MMRRREALTLIAGSLFSTGLLSAALAKPGKGNGNGHGGGNGNGNGNGGNGGGNGQNGGNGGGKKPKSVVLNGSVKVLGTGGFTLHVNGHGPGGYDVQVTVSADTLFVKGEAPIDPATVKVGAQVQVRGALDTQTQTLAATQVKLKNPGNDDSGGDGTGGTQVQGSVVSTNTTGFVVHPPAVAGVQPPDVNVVVTGTTTFTKPDNTAGSMADVVVGVHVTVQGTVDAATSSLVATSVAVTAAPPPPGP